MIIYMLTFYQMVTKEAVEFFLIELHSYWLELRFEDASC